MLRILSLAKDAREEKLGPDKHILSPSTDVKIKSTGRSLSATVYFVLAPIACFKILQRQMTLVDIQLDPHIKLHYLVAKILYYTFVQDDKIAASVSPLEYEPDKGKKADTQSIRDKGLDQRLTT
jgi:hypothetical protein